MKTLAATIAFILSLAISTLSFAHHSYVAEFDANNPGTIEGVVKEVWFKNPHIRYYITVSNDDGSETLWDVRGLSPVKLVRQGWTRRTIKVGDRIKIRGHSGRTNKTILSIIDITLPDGSMLTSRSVAYDITDNKKQVATKRITPALSLAADALVGAPVDQATAHEERFAGKWMLNVAVPGAEPLVGLLEIVEEDGKWVAYVENGPSPLKIDGNKIEVEVDTRDRQGFRFQRLLAGELKDEQLSGVLHSIDILDSAAEYGEDGSLWTAVRAESVAARESNAALEDFAGTWIGIRGVDFRKYTMDMTDSAKEWVAGYDARMDEAQKRCVSPGLVATATWIFPFEIIASHNRLTMMYEVFGLSRRIFIDQTAMPESYPESSMGYSQGRMDDGELIIETTLLSPSTRDFNGEPVGENARIIERYFLTHDGNRLNMIMQQVDPDNYKRPPIRRRAWDKNDESLILPFECDPDSFFRQLYGEGRMQEYIDRSPRRQ